MSQNVPAYRILQEIATAWKVSKYGFFSGPHFPVFSPNTGNYGPKKLRIWTPFTQLAIKEDIENA